jgi:hypothetical protein
MAFKKAIVLGADGSLQQLQPTDVLEVGVGNQGFITTNGNSTEILTEGQIVYVKSDGTVDLANADTVATSKAIGLVKDASVAIGASCVIVTDGMIEILDWTDVLITGDSDLVIGSAYYLSDVEDGKITSSRTTLTGSSVVYIGRAVSTTALEISIERPILL